MTDMRFEPRPSDSRAHSFNHCSTLCDLRVVLMIEVSLEGTSSLGIRLARPAPSMAWAGCQGGALALKPWDEGGRLGHSQREEVGPRQGWHLFQDGESRRAFRWETEAFRRGEWQESHGEVETQQGGGV